MYRQLFSLVTCHPIIVSPHLLIKIFIKTSQQKEKKIKILVKLTGCRRFFFIIWSNSWLILLYFSSVLGVNTNCCKTKKDKGSQVIPKYRNCNLNSSGSEINFFIQAPSGDWKFFFSRQMKKSGRQKAVCKIFVS